MYSTHTVCSIKLAGWGVWPEIRIAPEDGLIYFSNVLVGESCTKEFEVKNISNFPVKFGLIKWANGVTNKKGISVFTFIPSEGTVEGHSSIKIKMIFAPDRVNENFFEILTLDVPN